MCIHCREICFGGEFGGGGGVHRGVFDCWPWSIGVQGECKNLYIKAGFPSNYLKASLCIGLT